MSHRKKIEKTCDNFHYFCFVEKSIINEPLRCKVTTQF